MPPNSGVLRGELVTVDAMSPLLRAVDAALHIRLVGNRFEVVRSQACGIAAEVVKFESIGDRSDEFLIGDDVRLPILPVYFDNPVSKGIGVAGPQPAGVGLVDIAPKESVHTFIVSEVTFGGEYA